MSEINFLRVEKGGICFAHGPYSDTVGCPHPAEECAEIIQRDGPNPEYVRLAEEQVRRTNKVYTAADLDAARVEGAAAENQRCAEIANDYSIDEQYSPHWQHGATMASHDIRDSILASSPDPNYAQRIRDEVLEEAAKDIETWGASDDEPTDPDVAFSCLAAAIRAKQGE